MLTVRPSSRAADAAGAASGAGEEGERSFLFPAGSFCMDRLTLEPVQTVPLEDQDMDVERGVEDALLDEAAEREEATGTAT